ncbi:MAG: translation initiation factor IF-2 subunit gamma [Candidatus Nanoarchaeia archaeon]|jgi:translation initiation factor 2 subunit 3|nr:translation initiation factor IF-2 subunit gamma [Candidatus Nanoarchaeia archaeon]|tara:strand:- start:11367 stop:12608 length:1242 start_codon:yes stop_codon:yes gene_type:complete
MPRKKKEESLQPELNIGLIGHVDHGKTTLVSRLTGRFTDTHSEELKRGITIRLGYADTEIYKIDSKDFPYKTKQNIPKNAKAELVRKISFIDAPGHETLMATMLSGAAIMDAALLLVAANESCPQPQTKEHLMALNIIGIKNIIIAQNKIDLVSEEEAEENYKQIKSFVKGTIAEKAPIIPISAQQNVNIDVLITVIQENFPTPKRDDKKNPLMFVARSFDVNKPGTEINDLDGGVLGGALKQGKLKINDKIEIRPGLRTEREGKTTWQPLFTSIKSLITGNSNVKEIKPGGSIGVSTKLDPSIVKADSLIGSVVGLEGKLPGVWYEFELEPKLLDRVVGAKDELVVDPIKKGETLMLNVNSAATIGVVNNISKNKISVKLKVPVCSDKKDRITISRLLGSRFRLIGYGNIIK